MANILVKLLMDATGYEKGLQVAAGKTKAFEQAAATVTGTIGKIAGAFGVAMGSAEAFQKVIRGSQTTSDEYDRVLKVMKTSVDNFFSSLSTGDISSFLYKMDTMIAKAKEAYDALDQLGNTRMSYSVMTALNESELQEAITAAKNKQTSPENAIKAFEDWRNIIGMQEKALKQLEKDMEKSIKTEIQARAGIDVNIKSEWITEALLLDIKDDEERKKLKDNLARVNKKYEEELEAIEEKRRVDQILAKTSTATNLANEKAAIATRKLNEKYARAITVRTLLNIYEDNQLQEVGAMVSEIARNRATIASKAREFNETVVETNNRMKNVQGWTNISTISGYSDKYGQATLPKAVAANAKPAYRNVGLTEMQGLGSLAVGDSMLPTQLALPVEPMNTYEKQLEEIAKRQKEVADTAMYAGQMFGAMGQLAAASGNEALAGVMNSFGAVADMIIQLQKLTTVNALTGAASMPFPASLGAIATVMSTLASVWSSLNFAEGGIVPGSNYMDGITARVSSGEMVINTADQKRLYDAIHTGNLGGGGGGRMVVSGEQIVEVINNYGQRTGKGRLTFK